MRNNAIYYATTTESNCGIIANRFRIRFTRNRVCKTATFFDKKTNVRTARVRAFKTFIKNTFYAYTVGADSLKKSGPVTRKENMTDSKRTRKIRFLCFFIVIIQIHTIPVTYGRFARGGRFKSVARRVCRKNILAAKLAI